MKIGKAKLRSIIKEELARVLKEEDDFRTTGSAEDFQKMQNKKKLKRAKMAAPRAVTTVKDMWNFVTDEAGGEQEAIKLIKSATKGVSSNIGQAILKMFKEGEGQIQEGLLDFFTGSTINTLKKMGKKLVRDLGAMADTEGTRGDGNHDERMEFALNKTLEASGIPDRAQSAIRMLIASVGTL